jgi:DNA primase
MTDMARLPDETVTRIKQEVSLQRLAEGMGITLKRHGSDLIGLCPFHDDKEPSLVISPEKTSGTVLVPARLAVV